MDPRGARKARGRGRFSPTKASSSSPLSSGQVGAGLPAPEEAGSTLGHPSPAAWAQQRTNPSPRSAWGTHTALVSQLAASWHMDSQDPSLAHVNLTTTPCGIPSCPLVHSLTLPENRADPTPGREPTGELQVDSGSLLTLGSHSLTSLLVTANEAICQRPQSLQKGEPCFEPRAW